MLVRLFVMDVLFQEVVDSLAELVSEKMWLSADGLFQVRV